MIEIPISYLKAGQITDQPYFSKDGKIIVARKMLITTKDLAELHRKGITHLFVSGTSEDEELTKLINFDFPEDIPYPDRPDTKQDLQKINKPGKEGFAELLKSNNCEALDSKIIDISATSQPLGSPLIQAKAERRTTQYKSAVQTSYDEVLSNLKTLLQNIAAGRDVSADSIRSISSQLIKILLTDRSILLNLANYKSIDSDYLYHHTLNVTIIAINIAAAFGYNEQQITEIAMGALLHDAGMLLIPEPIRFKPARLTEEEWFEIQKHPILGVYLLEKIPRLPESVLFMAYQSHERENGKGYPKQRSGRLIHNYAKILAVADIYEALSSPRKYRDANLPYKAMETIIKMTKQGFISGEYVKTLLECTSLFPVGSIVELSTGCIAKVIQSNSKSYAKPIVRTLSDEKGAILAEEDQCIEDLVKNTNIQIVKALQSTHFSQDMMIGF